MQLVRRRLAVLDPNKCTGCQACMFACSRRFGEASFAKSAILIRSTGGIEHGFVPIVCRACPDPPCVDVCPTHALVRRKFGGVLLMPSRCIGCGYCVQACPFGAIFWDEYSNKPIVCVHCGYCASYCPYGVIKLVEEVVT